MSTALFCMAVLAAVAVFGVMFSERVDRLITAGADERDAIRLGRAVGEECRRLTGHG